MEDMETIYSYTRSQAIEDGVLIDVSETAKEAGFKIPVAITSAAYSKYVEWTEADNEQAYQDESGRLWDVLFMGFFAIKTTRIEESELIYEFFAVPRDGESVESVSSQLKLVIGGGDEGEPVLTIMLVEED